MDLLGYEGEMFKSDASLFPSYTKLTTLYSEVCKKRYNRMVKVYKDQFLLEHSLLELEQPRALDGIRFHREFCDPVLSPMDPADLIKLTPKQKIRLEYILENPIT